MAFGNNKLFKVRLKGISRGNFARNSSPGTLYIVAKSMDKAYNSVCLIYGSDPNYDDIKDFELDTIELVADESNPNTCLTDSYKLIMADDFYTKYVPNGIPDISAIKENIDKETENETDTDNGIDEDSLEE
jgi:hypothetical protein